MHYSIKGTKNKNNFEFPYRTLSPIYRKDRLYNSIDDVHDELIKAYNQTKDKSKIGTSLYLVHLYFANPEHILDQHSQNIIRAYMFAKEMNMPIFSNLMETPMEYIEKSQMIKEELMAHQKEEQSNGK